MVSIALIAPGAMGSAVAARLVEHGAEVLTLLDGRSAASVDRAAAAGMKDASIETIAQADIILSILPPADAMGLAQRLAPALEASAKKPVYIDCNALSPETKREVLAVPAAAGCVALDASIIGHPPKPGNEGPVFYVAGDAARRTAVLERFGLTVRRIDGPLGAAAALKMCYAGINKGMTALGSAMLLAASRAGAADDLRQEMSESLPTVLAGFQRSIPNMYPKAYRWIAEMREIAAFLNGEDEAAAMMFEGAARLFERLAADVAGEGREQMMLDAALEAQVKPRAAPSASR